MRESATSSFSPYAPLRSMVRRLPLQLPPQATVREAMHLLDLEHADALLVTDAGQGVVLGIVTLRDVLKRVAMAGVDPDTSVADIMTAGVITLPADATAHQASVAMLRRGVRHLVLVDADGRAAQLVSQADLFGGVPARRGELVASIAAAGDRDTLVAAAAEVREFSRRLLAEGLGPEAMLHQISALDDLLALQAIDLVAANHELPYVPWCWLVFGSEGRLERTLSTDQDNGLLFLAEDDAHAERLRAAFLPFAREVNELLDACGFRLCRGNIMASNPALCLSLVEWQRRFGEWMRVTEQAAVLNATIFFDFRALSGDEQLAARLRQWLLQQTPSASALLRAMAEGMGNWPSPLGWLSSFRFDDNADFPHTIDLKLHGVRPFVDGARIWALWHGVEATNTAERLRRVGPLLHMAPEETAAFVAALDHVQRLRFSHQLSLAPEGELAEGANRIDPDQLNVVDRHILKEAFRQAKLLQQQIEREFLRT